jgi:hypothetical protein
MKRLNECLEQLATVGDSVTRLVRSWSPAVTEIASLLLLIRVGLSENGSEGAFPR